MFGVSSISSKEKKKSVFRNKDWFSIVIFLCGNPLQDEGSLTLIYSNNMLMVSEVFYTLELEKSESNNSGISVKRLASREACLVLDRIFGSWNIRQWQG